MPLMNVFEPLFLLLAFAAVVTFVTAVVAALCGRAGRAGRILLRLAAATGVYFAIVIVVSAVTPRREYRVGDTQCFDDWCIAVVDVRRTGPPHEAVDVTLRLSNRARGRAMGEQGTVAYLVDAAGHRYDPRPIGAEPPLDTRIAAGGSVLTTRSFDVPSTAVDLGLVYTHEGGFPIGWLIISEGGWFQKPPIVRLTTSSADRPATRNARTAPP